MTTTSTELTLLRLSWKLQGDVEPARRREIRRELRAHLRSSAAEIGQKEALRRLGDLDDLAREYRDADRGRPRGPRIGSGVVSAIAVWVLLIVLDGRTIMSWNDLESRGDSTPGPGRSGLPTVWRACSRSAGTWSSDCSWTSRSTGSATSCFPCSPS